MDEVKVSIIIVNFNTFELTCQCIQSILDKVKGLAVEIILVDNHSHDVAPIEFQKKFSCVKLVRSYSNLGFAKGNNLGISISNARYILLLNSDTRLKNDAVSSVKFFLDQHKDVAAATARLEYPDGKVQHNCQRFPSIKYQLIELLRLQKISKSVRKNLFGPFFDYDSVAFPDWIWGTFFMFKKELLLQLPNQKLADDFFMYGEDMQWCLDFKKLNYKIGFVPEAQVIHYLGASKGNKNELMRVNYQKLMKQYYPRWKRKIISILNFLLPGR